MRLQSRTIEPPRKRPRGAPSSLALLRSGENKLRQGNVRDALKLFQAIVNRNLPSLERLAALSYLRNA